jgi:GntR family transcriptional regulator, transcriptional repressor for pyruvate dehydrogenase complex
MEPSTRPVRYGDTGRAVVRVPKAAELVAAELRCQIVRGELAENEALASESELMQHFGVSRPTLREAFRILESERLITVRRGARGGARVQLPDISVAANYTGLLLQVTGTTLGDVYEARKAIEPPMARACAERRSIRQLRDLQDCVEVEDRSIAEDRGDFAHHAARFHQLVVDGSGNTTLAVVARMLASIFERHLVVEVNSKGSREQRLADNRAGLRAHRRLVSLVESKEGAAAEAFWRKHMDIAGQYLLRDYGKMTVVDLFR